MIFFQINKTQAIRDGEELIKTGQELLEKINKGISISELEILVKKFEKKYSEITKNCFLSFNYLRGYLEKRKEITPLLKKIYDCLFNSCYPLNDPLNYYLGFS